MNDKSFIENENDLNWVIEFIKNKLDEQGFCSVSDVNKYIGIKEQPGLESVSGWIDFEKPELFFMDDKEE